MVEEVKIDSLDKEILCSLDENCRKSNSEIAKENRTTKNIVNYRINNLISKKIIQNFFTVIDPTMLGLEGYRVYIKLQYFTPEKEKEIIDFLVKEKSTWWVGSIEGNWDIGFIIWVKNAYKFREFWFKFTEKYQEFILKNFVCVYTKVYDFSYTFLSEKKRENKIMETGSEQKVNLSETQEKILREISGNARASTVELAKKLNLTPMIIKYNLKKIKELGLIKGFRTKINIETLGYTIYKLDFWLKNKSKYSEIMKFVQSHQNIIYLNETIGYADFEIELALKKMSEFQETVKEIKEIFADNIREHNYFIVKKIHKTKYY
ncbi:MAG: winged helix-turn-helix transcriptional regulator [Candidatus Diapherotrites archaeon]|nr:winged helix-turn-helix transcriptional regulator [Candidatus Diapherotrites archaeon]